MELWPKVDMETWKEYTRCFGCGMDNPVGLKLQFKWDGKTASADFTPGENHQGWGGYVHGGITACVLDEAMGWTALFSGYNNVTAKMQTRFRRMIPIGECCEVSCSIARQTSRLIETEAKLTGKDGTIYAEATSTQFIIGPRKQENENPEGKPPRAVIWDMDGVIADTAELHFRSWQFAFEKRGVTYTRDNFFHNFGRRNDVTIRSLLGENLSEAEIGAIEQDKENFFRADAKNKLTPFPGVINLLKIIAEQGIPSAIASSAPLENIELIINELGIKDYFKAKVYGKEVKEGKPDPQVFLTAAKKLGVKPENCIVIEDAMAGIKAAKAAGMRCIAVANSHPSKDLLEADMVVNSLVLVGIDDLDKLFEKRK